jgi:hypothetical protein
MKNETIIKDFHAVDYMREIRDKISAEIADMSKDEILRYFREYKPKERVKPSA